MLNESHLKRILSSYFHYYHHDRTHYSLEKHTPCERPVQSEPTKGGKVIGLPRVGGLHNIAARGKRLRKEALPSLLSSLPGALTRHLYLTSLRAEIVDKTAFLEEVDEAKPVIE